MTPPPGKPVVLVDGRLARKRRTGIARVINETRTALLMDPPADMEVVFTEGPPSLPRRNKLTSVGNLVIDMLWLTFGLPAMARRKHAALIHAPMNWGALRGHTPMTVMIQDLAFERMPDQYPGGFRRWASFVGKRTAKRARLVMTTTEAGARDVEQIYRVPRSRIRVVNLGTDPDHQPPREREPFILAVGEFEPRKRVLDLMRAHEKYFASAPGYPPLCRLVIAGAGGSQHDEALRLQGPGCDMLGFVPDEDLAELYRRATLFVSLSAYEGFGLPIAEAMARGCPVMVADNSSQAEVGGDMALLVQDDSIDGMARQLNEVLADREALLERGRQSRDRAAELSWAATARGTTDAWREALGLPR